MSYSLFGYNSYAAVLVCLYEGYRQKQGVVLGQYFTGTKHAGEILGIIWKIEDYQKHSIKRVLCY